MKRHSHRKPTRIFAVLCLLLFSLITVVKAQIATRDSSFNSTGSIQNSFYSLAAIQDDGKIIISSSYYGISGYMSDFHRILNNGSVDSSFTVTTINRNYSYPTAILKISPTGKFYYLCNEPLQYALYRFKNNGMPDSSFGVNGKRLVYYHPDSVAIRDMQLQSNGKIVLAGNKVYGDLNENKSFFIARLNGDGSADNSFGNNGYTTTDFNIRINEPLNSVYYNNYADIYSVQVQPDGKIIAAGGVSIWLNGYSNDSIALARYNENGELDASFNGSGKLTLLPSLAVYGAANGSFGARANKVVLQNDNTILVGADTYANQSHGQWFQSRLTLVKLTTTGMLDPQFGQGGITSTAIAPYNYPIDVAIQSDGKLLAATNNGLGRGSEYHSETVFQRFNSTGSTDNSFGVNSVLFAFDNSNQSGYYESFSFFSLASNRIYILSNHLDSSGLWALKTDGAAFAPYTKTICPGNNNQLAADIKGAAYQWQQSNDGINFFNLTESAAFTGVSTAVLTITAAAAISEGTKFRCLVSGSVSNVIRIHILQSDESEWTGAINESWENPANWMCNAIPTANTKVVIKKGTVQINSNVSIYSLNTNPAATIRIVTGKSLQLLH